MAGMPCSDMSPGFRITLLCLRPCHTKSYCLSANHLICAWCWTMIFLLDREWRKWCRAYRDDIFSVHY